MFCPYCGKENPDNARNCFECGAPLGEQVQNNVQSSNTQTSNVQNPNVGEQKSKMAAGLLGIFLGAWGIHNFYLGFTTRGIIQIIVTLCTCGIGGWWGIIEGILILTGSRNVDANGTPLRD